VVSRLVEQEQISSTAGQRLTRIFQRGSWIDRPLAARPEPRPRGSLRAVAPVALSNEAASCSSASWARGPSALIVPGTREPALPPPLLQPGPVGHRGGTTSTPPRGSSRMSGGVPPALR
jgi:hypothetical protein